MSLITSKFIGPERSEQDANEKHHEDKNLDVLQDRTSGLVALVIQTETIPTNAPAATSLGK